MRMAFNPQLQLDCPAVTEVPLNTNCRDETIPILHALQHVFAQPTLREQLLRLVQQDVNPDSSPELGRAGMHYWQILVLAVVRLGLNLNYDRLQDMVENHRALRHILGLGDWDFLGQSPCGFDWRRIRDNLCMLRPETLQHINQLVVAEGHRLQPDAARAVRGDSFVVETNIHYPTESSLILDGIRKVLETVLQINEVLHVPGWRQHQHLLRKTRQLARLVGRIGRSKGQDYQARLRAAYAELIAHAELILQRARELAQAAQAFCRRHAHVDLLQHSAERLEHFLKLTQQVCDTARRRVLLGEEVPNQDKLFSIFEPETQLIKRGKAAQPVQFGHLVLLVEDSVGFVCYYEILPRGCQEQDRAVPVLQETQKRCAHQVERASFDCAFHTPENQKQLQEIVTHPCVPSKGREEARAQRGSVEFREARQSHPGVESAIAALQAGNGQKECRDHTHTGFERYVGLGILGRNLHVLGKLLLAQEQPDSLAAQSRRKRRQLDRKCRRGVKSGQRRKRAAAPAAKSGKASGSLGRKRRE